MDLLRLTLHEARDLLSKREIRSVDLTRAYLDRIEAVDPAIGAYLTVIPEAALEQAAGADKHLDRGEGVPPLCGIPVGLKDNLVTRGVRTTCASRILENFIPPYDGTAVARLRDAGAVLLGKLNMDEFAMGSSNENSGLQLTRNPWDRDRVTGGSSGGPAAATSAGLCAAALGSDTGGSIRLPASYCGVVGLKPTYGRVSRFGLVAFASSLDQIGPLARDVTDCALMLQAISGYDPADSTSVDVPVPDYSAALEKGAEGVRVGIPSEYFVEGIDPDVETAVRGAAERLASAGAVLVDVSLPHTEFGVPVYYLIATAEASSNLARYDGVKYGHRTEEKTPSILEMYGATRSEGFGDEVKRRIMLGTYALSAGYYDAYYRKAQQVRTLIRRDFDAAFEQCDVILTPAAPTAAFPIGEKADDPLQMYLCDIFTISANLAGLPGLTQPCGYTGDGLPVGVQLMGRPFEETGLLRVGRALEKTLDLGGRVPGC